MNLAHQHDRLAHPIHLTTNPVRRGEDYTAQHVGRRGNRRRGEGRRNHGLGLRDEQPMEGPSNPVNQNFAIWDDQDPSYMGHFQNYMSHDGAGVIKPSIPDRRQ